jgi:hypothetical protein
MPSWDLVTDDAVALAGETGFINKEMIQKYVPGADEKVKVSPQVLCNLETLQCLSALLRLPTVLRLRTVSIAIPSSVRLSVLDLNFRPSPQAWPGQQHFGTQGWTASGSGWRLVEGAQLHRGPGVQVLDYICGRT